MIRLNHFSARIPTHRAVRCVLIADADYPTVNQFCLTGQGTGFGEEAGLLEGHTGCEELTAEGSALQTDAGGFTAPGSGAEGGDGFHAGPGTDRTGLFDELVEEEEAEYED